LEDSSKIAKKVCRPNAKLIWPKFGRDVQKVIVEAKNGNFEELEEGRILIRHPELVSGSIIQWIDSKQWIKDSEINSEWQKSFILEFWEYEMAYEKLDENMDIEAWFGMVIAMDAKLTPELIEEWYARDIVRHIQESRKEANFNVDDRIEIELKTENLELANSIEKFKNNIQAETLSTITEKLTNPSFEKDIELEEYKLKISLKKL
jgi:isoleucyl-tRNA synthetase